MVMSTNLYVIHDNFRQANNQEITGMMRQIHKVKRSDPPELEICGSSSSKREFLFVADLLDACMFLLDRDD